MLGLRVGWEFYCNRCPFKGECAYYGVSVCNPCVVIDYQNQYVVIKPPVKAALTFNTKNIMSTNKQVTAACFLEEDQDKTLLKE